MDHPDSTFGQDGPPSGPFSRGRGRPESASPPWYTQGPFAFARGILLRMAQKEHARTQFLAKLEVRKRATDARVALLNPNQDSDVLVEKYVFALNPSQFAVGSDLEFGVQNGWTAFKNPQVAFRALHLFVNTPCPGLVYICTVQAANVNAAIGAVSDGFSISRMDLNLPCLPPQNTMQVTGTWTTLVPPPHREPALLGLSRVLPKKVRDVLPEHLLRRERYTLALDFEGWATLIA